LGLAGGGDSPDELLLGYLNVSFILNKWAATYYFYNMVKNLLREREREWFPSK
jgi:hypothetical protein